jgi:hypothetical protein
MNDFTFIYFIAPKSLKSNEKGAVWHQFISSSYTQVRLSQRVTIISIRRPQICLVGNTVTNCVPRIINHNLIDPSNFISFSLSVRFVTLLKSVTTRAAPFVWPAALLKPPQRNLCQNGYAI